ncbi:MAG: glycoside hydrolase, partial [Candidatus Eremiobacteraeota bacterium]|nr:glycoside hydrolase [Candidatus Eremiobacteraeota bacterium]
HLFAPPLTYRVRRDTNTDTPLPPEEPAGENPPDGAIIDYALGGDANAPLTIAIDDAAGRRIRSYASTDAPQPIDPEIDVPTYWLRPTPIPRTGPGEHRFMWDLREPPPSSVVHGYPIAAIIHATPRAPQGVLVPPGRYVVRLTVAGRTYTQPLRIVMDPRVSASTAALREQYTLASQIVTAMNHSYAAMANANARKDTAAAKRYARLNTALAALLEVVDGADAAPTVQARATVAHLIHDLALGGRSSLDVGGSDEP